MFPDFPHFFRNPALPARFGWSLVFRVDGGRLGSNEFLRLHDMASREICKTDPAPLKPEQLSQHPR